MVSSDEVQIALVKEQVYGVTPATPAFLVLPLTGESLAPEISEQTSNLMSSDRQTMDLIISSISASGSISTEFAVTPAMKLLLESAMADSLVAITPKVSGAPDLEETMIGKNTVSFTIEKRFPDKATPGSFHYQRITGAVVNTASFAVTPDEPATMSFGIIGKDYTESSTIITGATYQTPTNPIVLRGPDTTVLTMSGQTLTVSCYGEFGFELNNAYRGIQCLGSSGFRSMNIGQAEISLSATIQYSDNSLMTAFLNGTETALDFTAETGGDPLAHAEFHFPRVKISSNANLAGGTGQDVVNTLSMQALFNSSGTKTTLGSGDADKTSMRIVVGEGAANA